MILKVIQSTNQINEDGGGIKMGYIKFSCD